MILFCTKSKNRFKSTCRLQNCGFIDCPIKIQNQRYEELGIEPLELGLRQKIGLIISPEKLDSVPQSIANLIADKEKYKQRLARLRGENVFAFGQSSKVCAQYILDIVNGNNEESL